MTSPSPNFEEMAALRALGLLDEADNRELLAAAADDPEVGRLVGAFDETAAHLAWEAPGVSPPPGLRDQILQGLPAAPGKILRFPQWLPYAVAACLMAVCMGQNVALHALRTESQHLQVDVAIANDTIANLRASNALTRLRLATLDAKDPGYAAARVVVAWDSLQHRGSIAMENVPLTPAGHDYQLWVLDPNAPNPISAGIIKGSQPFEAAQVSVSHPGFAVTLEPSGGSATPTEPILFAVAPAD